VLILFCVEIVQTNNNESSGREKKKQFFRTNKQKNENLARKQKKLMK
jgi:hypothetical protein